jgi:hypothetical protein
MYLNYSTSRENEQKIEYMQAGIIDAKFVRNLGAIIVGGVGLISGYKTIIEDNKVNHKAIDLINSKVKEAQESKEMALETKTAITAMLGRLKVPILNRDKYKNKLLEIDQKIINKYKKLHDESDSLNEKEKSELILEIEHLTKIKNYELYEWGKDDENLKKAWKEIIDKFGGDDDNKNNLISFNIFNIFESLDPLDRIALSLLLLSQVIFSALVSIIFIFYGEYLIIKFDLERKYPRLAKFIQLRRKFQQYYLLFSILIIVSVLLIEILFFIAILLR